MMWGDGMHWNWLFWFLLAGGVIVLGFVLVVLLTGSTRGRAQREEHPPADQARARGILQERYARGEISTEEYRERLRTLEEGT